MLPAETLPKPKQYGEKYTEKDKELVCTIIDWLNLSENRKNGWNQSLLARQATIRASTLNGALKGSYPSPPTKHLEKAMEIIEREKERTEKNVTGSITTFVETSIYEMVLAACRRAHVYRAFSVVSAYVGTGKTTAVKHYKANHPSSILLEATPDMTASVMLSELVDLVGAIVHKANKWTAGTKAEKMRAIINALKGTDRLLIFDEAETVSHQCLEYIRRISDQAEIGVVLSGTEKLKPLIKDPRGRFGQISSRVIFWPPVIKAITRVDADALTAAGLSDCKIKISDEVYDAFWQMSDGSARVLCKSLIPGVRDYGLKKGKTLTPELVFKVGQQVLGFKKPATRRN